MAEDGACLERITERAAHAEVGVLREHDAQMGVEIALRAGSGMRPMPGFEAEVQYRVLGGVGISTEKVAVVFLFAPTEARNQGQGLVGVRRKLYGVRRIDNPSGTDISVCLHAHRMTQAGR